MQLLSKIFVFPASLLYFFDIYILKQGWIQGFSDLRVQQDSDFQRLLTNTGSK